MEVLLIGGTSLVDRHIIEQELKHGFLRGAPGSPLIKLKGGWQLKGREKGSPNRMKHLRNA